VLLLDEVVAHLDPSRRRALHVEIEKLEAQVWMTGADTAGFAEVAATAEVLEITPGQIARRMSQGE
jgi:DNA replication and repair protein RecF